MSATVDELMEALKQDCGQASLDSALEKARALARVGSDEMVERVFAEICSLDEVDLEEDAGDVADELFRLAQSLSTALGSMQGPPIDALLELAADESRLRARCCAIRTLGMLRSTAAVPQLMRILDAREVDEISPTMDVIEALGQIGDARAVSRLIALLDVDEEVEGNSRWLVRLAAKALGQIRDPRALSPLADLMRNHPDWFVRLGAVEGLAAMRQGALVREASNDPHPQVRAGARKALGMPAEEEGT